jgi:cystathionine gamma-synthase
VGWATKDPKVLAHLKTGYPRFFIHRFISDLAKKLLALSIKTEILGSTFGHVSENDADSTHRAVLFPHPTLSILCRDYLQRCETDISNREKILAFQVDFAGKARILHQDVAESGCKSFQSLCVVAFPDHLFREAKAFWQHTGFGISGRLSLYWLEQAPCLQNSVPSTCLDSRLPLGEARCAATTIRERISGLLSSEKGMIQPEDVILYPSGMSAIAHSASALQELYDDSSVSFRVAVFG